MVGATLDPAAAAWPANYRRYFSSVDSLAVERAIIGHDPGDDHLTTVLDLMEGFVTESSVRTVFFSLLANAIGATYYASAFRTRLREIVYEETGHSVLSDSQAIVAHLNETFRLDLGKDDFIANDVPVPFVLSAALAGVSTCAGLCENIVKLRDIAAPLRAKRAELARAWSNQDQSSVHALIKAVTDDARHLADTEYFAGHGLIARWILSPGGARPALGALGRLLVSFAPLPDDVKAVLRNRSVRPELWAVSRLSAQARRVINCVDPMYELLRPKGLKPSTQDRDRHLRVLRRLAA